MLTFASESYPGYHSVGTAIAFNVFDVVVPTYLFNTVNEFDADYAVRRISLSPVKYIGITVIAVRNWLKNQKAQLHQAVSFSDELAKRTLGARPSANQ